MNSRLALVRALLLVVAVVFGVALVEAYLPGGWGRAFRSLGLTESGWTEPDRLVICDTRATRIETASGHALMQQGRDWLSDGPETYKLSFIAVEKWLAEHCEVAVAPLQPGPLYEQPKSMALRWTFVNGETALLYQLSPDVFEWRGRFYRSQQLAAALRELDQLLNGQ